MYPNINKILRKRIVEPKKRWVGGVYTWAIHRFEIKNGISLLDTTSKQENPLMKLVKIIEPE